MQTVTQDQLLRQSGPGIWPTEFTKRRKNFKRETEHQTYIEYVQGRYDDRGDVDDVDDSSEDEDEVNVHRSKSESNNEYWITDKDTELENGHSSVRIFMEGAVADKETLQYRDQVKQVVGFFEQASRRDLNTRAAGKYGKSVALLDDRNDGGIVFVKEGHRRPYQGPLTAQKLWEELKKKRFRVESHQNVPINEFDEEGSDAERRLIFITDFDASTLEVITTTASRSQAPALRDLFYKYLTSRMSIGVNIPTQGFQVFTLDFHIPYYVLREGKELLKDARKKFDGEHLRQSWPFPFLSNAMSMPKSTNKSYFLYEAQMSIVVTGVDCSVWVAYGFFDTYFESDEREKESVERYHQWKGHLGQPDPFSVGQILANEPIWTPREYFLKIKEIRIKQVRSEWHCIVDKVENDVKQSRTKHAFPLSSNDPKIRQEIRDFSTWNTQMVNHLRQFISCLSDTVGAWTDFQRKEIGYFLDDGDSPTASSLKRSIVDIDKTYSELNCLLRKLEQLKKELCEDNPQGLYAHLCLENNDAAKFQQRTAGHIQVLTVITIVFYPLGLATSLFSTQGVLPFPPSLAYFTCVFFILVVLVVVTLVVLYNWDSWFQPIFDYALTVLKFLMAIIQLQGQKIKPDKDHDQQLSREAICASKQRSSLRRPRKARSHKSEDPENATDTGKGNLKKS